jgi:hypothetical protein
VKNRRGHPPQADVGQAMEDVMLMVNQRFVPEEIGAKKNR